MTFRDPTLRTDPQTGDDNWDFPEGIDPHSPDYALRHPPKKTGSGSSSTTTADGPTIDPVSDGPTDYTDEEQTRFNGLPGLPEIWKDSETGVWYVVYLPESGPQPPVPLLFSIETDEELKSLFGNKDPVADKTMTSQEFMDTGAVKFGEMASLDRYNAAGELILDPWAGFTSRMERAMLQMPWLAEDAEVFAITAGAYLEGRDLEEWELENTDYFQSHSKAQRDSMRMQLSDPEGYADRRDKFATTIFDEIAKYGIDPGDEIVGWVADKYNSGDWTLDQTLEQIQAYAGRGGSMELDSEFDAFLIKTDIARGGATSNIDTVRDLFDEWVGPAFPPDDDTIRKWATMISNNDAGGRDALVEHLRTQRKVLFPAYEDENATYRDIAAPWKSYATNIWGVPIDETDAAFQAIVQFNDPEKAKIKARQVGSERGYARVVESMSSDIQRSMRTGVRGAV